MVVHVSLVNQRRYNFVILSNLNNIFFRFVHFLNKIWVDNFTTLRNAYGCGYVVCYKACYKWVGGVEKPQFLTLRNY